MGLVASDLQTVDRLNTFMPNYETSVRELARRYEDMIFSLELFASNADHSMSICQDAFNSGPSLLSCLLLCKVLHFGW